MGGGLAAEVAGSHAALVRAAVLLDPVNYALQSSNVPWTGVAGNAPAPSLYISTMHLPVAPRLMMPHAPFWLLSLA